MRNPMNSAPRLSIVIATWNAVNTLERCLHSIMAQDFDDWEILISDGGSTDGTVELILREGPAIGWWQTKKDKGIYDAWNQALDYARGEYVAFLGADDTLHAPSALRHVFELIGKEKYDLVTGRGVLVNQDGRAYYEFGNAWDYGKLRRRMTICHPGALHRRDLFEQYGKFDTSYRISADYDFLLRLPAELRTLHLDMPITTIADAGISRNQRWLMLLERYRAQANCPRIGTARAVFNFIDKLWRIPVAKALGMPN